MRSKRLLALILALICTLSLSACAGTAVRDELEGLASLSLLPGDSDVAGSEQALPAIGDSVDTAGETPDNTESGDTTAKENTAAIDEDGVYTSKEDVALYIHTYGKLPSNFITKKEAQDLGWSGGSLEPYAPGKCIGGSRFGNYEGILPDAPGRKYTECDIDTLGKSSRGAKRIVFSNDGLIYYTDDHYESFTLLYGGDE